MLTLPVKCILSLPEEPQKGVFCMHPLPPLNERTTEAFGIRTAQQWPWSRIAQAPGQVEGKSPGRRLSKGTAADQHRLSESLRGSEKSSPLISGTIYPAGLRVFARERPKTTGGLMNTQTSAAPVIYLPPAHLEFLLSLT